MTSKVVNRKWATLKDQKMKMQLNGFVMNTSVDKVDELFDEGIIRYLVNHVIFELDFERQVFFEEKDKRPPCSRANSATIAGEEGGTSDVVEHNKSGVLLDPRNIVNFTKEIETFINDEAKAETMGKVGHFKAFNFHQKEEAGKIFSDIIKKLISRVN